MPLNIVSRRPICETEVKPLEAFQIAEIPKGGRMARVIPTEVVRVMDRLFPELFPQTQPQQPRLSVNVIGSMSAVVALIDRIPQELIALGPTEYAEFITNLEILRSKSSIAVGMGPNYSFSSEPLVKLREFLGACPDAAATASGHKLKFVSPKELRADLRVDISDAYHSLNDGRWKAATVLAGAVIEALLVWRLSGVKQAELQPAIAALPVTSPKQRPQGPPSDWRLWQLIEVVGWFPSLRNRPSSNSDWPRTTET